MTSATYGAGNAYHSVEPEVTPYFARSFDFCEMFCTSLFVFFRLTIELSDLRLTVSDYPFGIFKRFITYML